jgi:DNA-binding NarL/FixJ family response regulator
MKKISMVIIDDHKLIREMWVILFAEKPGIEITGQAANLKDAVELVKTTRPDIVLLDINLAEDSGLDAVPQIRKFSPHTRIIVVSMHNQPAYAKKMMNLGARAYVTKNSSHEEIFKAVEAVREGRTYLCTEIKDILADQALNDEPETTSIKDLSFREIEIIKHLKEGLSSKEIAAALHISLKTVEVHRSNILKKLHLKNVASLISYINTTDLAFN